MSYPDHAPVERVDLHLPSLACGEWAAAQPFDSEAEAVEAIHCGLRVSTSTPELAAQIKFALSEE